MRQAKLDLKDKVKNTRTPSFIVSVITIVAFLCLSISCCLVVFFIVYNQNLLYLF